MSVFTALFLMAASGPVHAGPDDAAAGELAGQLCTDGGFTDVPSRTAFLRLLETTGGEAMVGLADDPGTAVLLAYETCLIERFELSQRQARCHRDFDSPCETPQQWRQVDASLTDQAAPPTEVPDWIIGEAAEVPQDDGTWWSPGSAPVDAGIGEQEIAPGPPIQEGRWKPSNQPTTDTYDQPLAWYFEHEVHQAWEDYQSLMDDLAARRLQAQAADDWGAANQAMEEEARQRHDLETLLERHGTTPAQVAERQEQLSCTREALGEDNAEGTALSTDEALLLDRTAWTAWRETQLAYATAVKGGLDDEAECLRRKLLALEAYRDRASALYGEAVNAVQACDAEDWALKMRLLRLAVARSEALSEDARDCISPEEAGTSTTVVSVESPLEAGPDPLEPIEGPLGTVAEEFQAIPAVLGSDVSPFQ